MEASSRKQHFVLVTYPSQGHINPVIRLAERLARTAGAPATLAISVSAYRRMFPHGPAEGVDGGLVSYAPISDGYDDGLKEESQFNHFMSQLKLVGSRSLSDLVLKLAARGLPATCIIYTFFLPWAAEVAREHGIPSALCWIQPANVFSMYYHYFHGYDSVIAANSHDSSFTVNLPGLPPVWIQDLPSFLTISPEDNFYAAFTTLRDLFATLDGETTWPKPKVLMNTFDGLEPSGIASIGRQLDVLTVGPLVPSWSIDGEEDAARDQSATSGDLFKPDEKRYMEWLDTKPEKSVVYVSFGSYLAMKGRQLEEMLRGLKESGRPYLLIVRKDSRGEGTELDEEREEGMVVEWCSQVRVLSHPAVGCFVTHCGWNSTTESLVCGVPMVGVPRWTDQKTNAKLAEEVWGTGIRGKLDEEGVLGAAELKRCLEMVMDRGEKGAEMRRKAFEWRERARDAIRNGGSSDTNLKAFVESIIKKK